jgi:hypothetical protein
MVFSALCYQDLVRINIFEIEKVLRRNLGFRRTLTLYFYIWTSFHGLCRALEHKRQMVGVIAPHSRAMNLPCLLRIGSELDIEESCDMVINSTYLNKKDTHDETQMIQN